MGNKNNDLVERLRKIAEVLSPWAEGDSTYKLDLATVTEAAGTLEEINAACFRVRGVDIADAIRDYIDDARRLHAEKMNWQARATTAEADLAALRAGQERE